ncbi:hypothetical protein MRX96_002720 [Rhipicephalus microplus]
MTPTTSWHNGVGGLTRGVATEECQHRRHGYCSQESFRSRHRFRHSTGIQPGTKNNLKVLKPRHYFAKHEPVGEAQQACSRRSAKQQRTAELIGHF